jgi:hypothetical protein
MLMTLAGMVMEVRAVVLSNAAFPMETSWLFSAKVMEVRAVALENV